MGVAEDAALFLQVDFEVFGHVQGDLKNLSLTTHFGSSKNTIIIICSSIYYMFEQLHFVRYRWCSIFNVFNENMRANKLNDEQVD